MTLNFFIILWTAHISCPVSSFCKDQWHFKMPYIMYLSSFFFFLVKSMVVCGKAVSFALVCKSNTLKWTSVLAFSRETWMTCLQPYKSIAKLVLCRNWKFKVEYTFIGKSIKFVQLCFVEKCNLHSHTFEMDFYSNGLLQKYQHFVFWKICFWG